MSFSYDPTTELGTIRFLLGDTQEDDGVLPGGKNLSDEELSSIYETCFLDLGYALYTVARSLAARWASVPENFNVDGLIVKHNNVSNKWSEVAAKFAKDYGIAQKYGANGLRSIRLLRTDAGDEIENT